ncbi:MAG: rod shape-determining protein MreC, partial [Planctomycetota bacterium]
MRDGRTIGSLWPTASAVALGAVIAVAPPGLGSVARSTMLDLAGPALVRLPALPTRKEQREPPPTAELAGEIARLRTELASRPDEADRRLIRPQWLRAAVLGSAERRGETAALLIARFGEERAGAEAAALNGDLPALDAGADQQVGVGDLVVNGNAVVGRVAAVGRWTATVRPLADPDFRLAVTLPGGGPNPGQTATAVLAGTGEPQPALLHLPTAATITVGAVVSCDVAETGGPALPVGVVTTIEPSDADGRRLVRIRPLAKLNQQGNQYGSGEVQIVRAGLNRRRLGPTEAPDSGGP